MLNVGQVWTVRRLGVSATASVALGVVDERGAASTLVILFAQMIDSEWGKVWSFVGVARWTVPGAGTIEQEDTVI